MPAAGQNLVKWYGRRFKRVLRSKLLTGLEQAGAYCEAVIVRSMGGSPSQPGSPPGRDTGEYARTITHEVNEEAGGIPTARVGTSSKLGLWLEYGTGSRSEKGGRSYIIVPKKASVLSWAGAGGRQVFAKFVLHPGIHPRPHIRPAVFGRQRQIMSILQKASQI